VEDTYHLIKNCIHDILLGSYSSDTIFGGEPKDFIEDLRFEKSCLEHLVDTIIHKNGDSGLTFEQKESAHERLLEFYGKINSVMKMSLQDIRKKYGLPIISEDRLDTNFSIITKYLTKYLPKEYRGLPLLEKQKIMTMMYEVFHAHIPTQMLHETAHMMARLDMQKEVFAKNRTV